MDLLQSERNAVIVGGRVHGVWLIPLMIFCLAFINISSSAENNWNITLLELAFCLGSLVCLGPVSFKVRPLGVAVLFTYGVLLLCNGLAERDGISPASWQRAVGVMMHIAFALVIARWCVLVPEAIHWLVWAVLLAVVTYFTVLAGYWISLDDPLAYDWFYAPPLFRHIRHVAYFLCIGTVVAAWAFFSYVGWQRYFAWVVCGLGMGMLLWSGGRGAMFATVLGMISMVVRFSPKGHALHWTSQLLALLLALWGAAMFAVNQKGLGWISAFSRSADSASLDQMSSNRLTIWSFLAEKIVDRPWFGWGGEGFSSVWSGFPIVQAHNGLFQLLIEWGIVGTLCICMLLGLIFIKGVVRYIYEGTQAAPILSLGVALIFALLILACVDGVFYHGTPFGFLMIGFGMLAAALRTDIAA